MSNIEQALKEPRHPTSDQIADYLVGDDAESVEHEWVQQHLSLCQECRTEVAERCKAMSYWDSEEGQNEIERLSARLLERQRKSKTVGDLVQLLKPTMNSASMPVRIQLAVQRTGDVVHSFVLALMQGLVAQQFRPAMAYRGNIDSGQMSDEATNAYERFSGGEVVSFGHSEGLVVNLRPHDDGLVISVESASAPVEWFHVRFLKSDTVINSFATSTGRIRVTPAAIAAALNQGLDSVVIERDESVS